MIPFRRKIKDTEADTQMDNKLKSELSGIFNWSLDGYRSLKERGYFTTPKESQALADDLREDSNSVVAFFNTKIIVNEFPNHGKATSFTEFYQAYYQMCQDDQSPHKSKRNFNSDMKDLLTERFGDDAYRVGHAREVYTSRIRLWDFHLDRVRNNEAISINGDEGSPIRNYALEIQRKNDN